MGKSSKVFAVFIILIMAILGLIFATIPFGLAQSGTKVSGIISQNTNWTKANSPYSLTGPLGFKQGVTLTIEAGTVVDLNHYYMQVNGTLIARGTSTSKIQFNGGNLQGLTINGEAGSGSTIQYGLINSAFSANSITIDHCTVTGRFSASGSSSITNNIIAGGVTVSDSTSLIGNVISGIPNGYSGAHVPIVSANTQSYSTSTVIVQNNTIIGGNSAYEGQAYTGISCFGHTTITDNVITNCQEAIYIVSFSTTEHIEIHKNTLNNNGCGIFIEAGNSDSASNENLLIEANLIANNVIGINVQRDDGIAKPTIRNNNIYNNGSNLNWGLPTNVDASDNWWGTTNELAINQSIYDFKNDFNLGTVTFTPFLTAPNIQAPSVNTPLTTPNPSASPPTSQNAFPLSDRCRDSIMDNSVDNCYNCGGCWVVGLPQTQKKFSQETRPCENQKDRLEA